MKLKASGKLAPNPAAYNKPGNPAAYNKPKKKKPPAPGPPGAAPVASAAAPQGVNGNGQLPWDAQYETQSGLLNRNYQNQIASLGQQETDTRSQFGFDSQYANNPLTRSNLLQRSYEQSRLGATNNMAARGQLYSGATSNALGYADFNHAQQYNDLTNQYQGLLNKYSQGRIAAQQSLDEGLAGAKGDALSRALGTDPEALPPDVAGDGSGGGATRKGLRKKGKGGGPAKPAAYNKPGNPAAYNKPKKRK